MAHKPTSGAYRAIFKEAIKLLIDERGDVMSSEKYADCLHYSKLLDDTDYKFGKHSNIGASEVNFFTN